MYELEYDVVERLRGVFEALRVGLYDLRSLNVSIPKQQIDYLRKLVCRNQADCFLAIPLPVQDHEFDRFHNVNFSQIPVG